MYLHEDKEKFRDLIIQISDETNRITTVIEKDYYVTLILRFLSKQLDNCVFKGGTSLSKGFNAINRFSEDIDITFDEHIGDYLIKKNHLDLAKEFSLEPFEMKLQALERTYIDKIFALCDYYMQNRSKRCSRHLYDIYKLSPMVVLNTEFYILYEEIRLHRANMKICPSAKDGVDVAEIIREFCDNNFYKKDYILITNYFVEDMVEYSNTINQMRKIADWIDSEEKC